MAEGTDRQTVPGGQTAHEPDVVDHSPRGFIKNPQDFWGGLGLVAFSLFALWASSDLPGMRGFAFGPGTAPRLFAGLLLATGAGVTLVGLLSRGPKVERYHWRGPLFVCAATIFFALSIRPLGLVISSFFTIMIAAAASPEARWIESMIWAAALTVFCVGLFVYGLNLPMQLIPRF